MHTRHHTTDQVAALGRLVVVWAHPDDEAYLSAGVMAIARSLGQPVTCITATSGDWAAEEEGRQLARKLRLAELDAALDILDVDDRIMLDLGDGRCHLADHTAVVDTIAELIADRRPDTVLTFGPDGFTGHLDHRTVSSWTTRATRVAAPSARLLYTTSTPELLAEESDVNSRFAVFEPGFPVLHDDRDLALSLLLDGQWLDRKLAALDAHTSQTAWLIDALGRRRYRQWVRREMFVNATDW